MTQLTGLTLDDAATARWLEHRAVVVDRVEIVADGFFARPSPYLAWLGAQFPLIVRALSLPSTIEPGSDRDVHALTQVCASARPRSVILPLALRSAGGIRLPQSIPAPLDPAGLRELALNVRALRASLSATVLLEPFAAPLRLTPAAAEPSLLAALCRETDCRLLLDLSALVEDARRHEFDPDAWLDALPRELIAGVRVGLRSGAGQHADACETRLDNEALVLLARLADREAPELVLLDPCGCAGDADGLRDHLEVLRAPRGVASDERTVSFRRVAPSSHAAGPASHDSPSEASGAAEAPGAAPAEGPPRIAPDAALFVLDSAGVCFFEPTGELTLLNTAATFIWCLLEDGEAPASIARQFAATFDVAPAAAERLVADSLRDLFGRGYVTRPARLAASPLSLLPGVAMLLVNARLRAAFWRDPARVARDLAIAAADRAAFVALDPAALDAQAVNPHLGVLSNAAPSRAIGSTSGARHYRLLSTTFGIAAERAEIAGQLDAALGHLSVEGDPDIVIEVEASGRILENGATLTEIDRAEAIVPAVKQRLRAVAVERSGSPISVHAAVLAFGDACVLLPAAAGSGKTTLTAALVAAGATYFSDEIAVFDRDSHRVVPVPLALTVKDGSVAPLRAVYPHVERLTAHVREDYVRVRYLPPPPGALPARGRSAAARFLVFPRFTRSGETALLPVDRPEALRRLLDESFLDHRALDRRQVEALVQWMRTLDCYELPFSSLAQATRLVHALFSPGATSQ